MTNKTTSSQDWREYRRLRVWEMHQQGYKQEAIAQALGLTQPGVSQIISRAKQQGPEALRWQKPKGVSPRLSQEQKAELLAKLAQGAEAFGFQGDVWTTERIAQLIEKEYQVKYHRDYIGPLLRGLGWSVHKPVVRAKQRDEVAIQQWQRERWPVLKKKP